MNSRYQRPRALSFFFRTMCLLAPFALLIGCAPRLSTQEAAVQVVTDRSLVSECTYLGPVYGEERRVGGLLLGGVAESSALARLKQEAARLGGDTVALASKDTGFDGSQTLGEAFRCVG